MSTGHKNQRGYASLDGFLYGKIYQRLVDDGQHFFGNGFGRWQETGSQTSDGKDGFPNRLHGFGFTFDH